MYLPDFSSPQVRLQVVPVSSTVLSTHAPLEGTFWMNSSRASGSKPKRWLKKPGSLPHSESGLEKIDKVKSRLASTVSSSVSQTALLASRFPVGGLCNPLFWSRTCCLSFCTSCLLKISYGGHNVYCTRLKQSMNMMEKSNVALLRVRCCWNGIFFYKTFGCD